MIASPEKAVDEFPQPRVHDRGSAAVSLRLDRLVRVNSAPTSAGATREHHRTREAHKHVEPQKD
jgi:hypothetical protein